MLKFQDIDFMNEKGQYNECFFISSIYHLKSVSIIYYLFRKNLSQKRNSYFIKYTTVK